MEFQSTLPYPKVKVENKNIDLANILSFNYAGNVSELSATNLYSYESFIFDEISDVMEKISIVEMHHLELLAKTIKLLGLDPKYQVNNLNQTINWTSNNINYPKTVKEALMLNIENEKKAIYNYNEVIKISDDQYVNDLLKRIILDEQIHINIFENLLKK